MSTHGPTRKNIWGEQVKDVYSDDGRKVGEIVKEQGFFAERTRYKNLDTGPYSSGGGGVYEGNSDAGLGALLMGNPFMAAIGGLAGAFVGGFGTLLGKIVVAAAAKALGASPHTQLQILSIDPWVVAVPAGWISFVLILVYLTVKWFRIAENRETFVTIIMLILFFVGLILVGVSWYLTYSTNTALRGQVFPFDFSTRE
jgi:hypothetical protein